MSAGNFIKTKYQADYLAGQIHPIRLQPETIGTVNTAPAGAVNNPISANASPARRRIGLFARYITVRPLPPATIPDTYSGGTLRVVILQPTVFAGLQVGGTFTYLGSAMTIISKNPEVVR